MKVVPFEARHARALSDGLQQAGVNAPLLEIPAFVTHFFLSRPSCRLLLLMDGNDRILATLGSEQISMRMAGQNYVAAVLSGTYALQPGAFPFLFMHWMKSAQVGLAFPGNELLRGLFARQPRWRGISGLRRYWLNWAYPAMPGDPHWKRLARPLVRWARCVDASAFERRLEGVAPAGLTVTEVQRFTPDMLKFDLPEVDAFEFQVPPDADELNWRFDTSLAYVRYRAFQYAVKGRPAGYVVIAEWPNCLIISRTGGADPHALACAVLVAIARLNQGNHRYRKVLLSSMHAGMVALWGRFGFRPAPRPTPFYMAAFGECRLPDLALDKGLVDLDLGDAGIALGLHYKP